MSQPIVCDYASVDGNPPPHFPQLRNAGVRGAIVRAIWGRPSPVVVGGAPFRDPTWARDKDPIRAAGLKRGAYGFVCVPNRSYGYTPDPEEQADAFIDYVKLDVGVDMPPWFDVEEESTLDGAGYFAWVMRYVDRIRAHYGCWPGMYTGARVWAEILHHHAAGALINCPLWLAKPWPVDRRKPVHLDGMPTYTPILIPEFGTNWINYQYQGDARNWPGGLIQADASRWRVSGPGAKGTHVVWLQKRLVTIDKRVKIDGDYGPITTEAVKLVQQANRLVVDGYFGIDTFAPVAWMKPVDWTNP